MTEISSFGINLKVTMSDKNYDFIQRCGKCLAKYILFDILKNTACKALGF